MKSIAEILSSLPQPPQPLGASQGVKPVSSNSDQSKSGSFADVVKQLNTQPANNGSTVSSGTPDNSSQNSNTAQTAGAESTPGSGAAQVTAFDAIDIQFTETIREGSSTNQNQVQQSLAGLASAFQQMVSFLLSNPGVSADQVQNQIVSATQGAITPDAAKALVAAVQGFLQSLPPSQKSLLADESTRQDLFNQLFQGLAAGAAGAANNNKSNSDGSIVSENFNLQMAFGTSALIQTANDGQSAETTQSGSQFFAADVSMSEANDNQLQTFITNSVLDAAPLSAGLADLTQQEGQLLTNLASGQNASGSPQSPLTGQDLANLLNRAQAGEVNLTSFNQNKPALSSDQLNKIANIDFNQIFNSLTQQNQNAATALVPPVTQADTLQAPMPGLPSVLGGSNNATIETSILSMPPVVTLQNLAPQALAQGTFPNLQQAGLINRIFQEISASFNAPALAAPAPAFLTAASVTPAATLGSGNPNQSVGSGLTDEASSQAALDAAPQTLNSTPASGNTDQTQDTQTFQNFLRSSVVFDAEKFTFSVDTVNAPNTTTVSLASAAVGSTVNNQVPATQGNLPSINSPQGGSQPPTVTPSTSPVVVPLALNTISQPAVGMTVKETVSAAALFTNTVIAAQTARPVAAPALETENLQNNNQALPTDPNVSAVQSINPVLAQGVNSVTTVAEFASIKDQAKTQDPLSAVDNSSQPNLDSAVVVGSGTFSQVVQANSQNAPINAAGIIQQFAEQISQHASQVHTVSRLSFQLVPESLGKVTIQVALVDQSVSARIIVTNPDVKDGLQSHMVDLKAALSQAGLQIDQLQVQIQGGSANLLAQYYQYQQEGSSYGSPVGNFSGLESSENDENTGVLGSFSQRNTLVNLLV